MFFECTPVELHDYGLITSLLLGGLVGGLSHCTIMCAPFVLSLQQKQSGRLGSILLLPYHAGRMTTYVILGVCAQIFLSYAFPVSALRVWMSSGFLLLAALLFWVQAIPVLGSYLPFLMRIRIPAPFRWMQQQVGRLMDKPGWLPLYVVGFLLGFIPCGLILGALLAAATASTAGQAALGMAAFAAGTVPSLIGIAIFGKSLATLLPRGGTLLSKWVLVINGVVLLSMAVHILTRT